MVKVQFLLCNFSGLNKVLIIIVYDKTSFHLTKNFVFINLSPRGLIILSFFAQFAALVDCKLNYNISHGKTVWGGGGKNFSATSSIIP